MNQTPKRSKTLMMLHVRRQIKLRLCQTHHRIGNKGPKKCIVSIQAFHPIKFTSLFECIQGESYPIKSRDILAKLTPATYKRNCSQVFKSKLFLLSAFRRTTSNISLGVIRQRSHLL